MGHLIMGTPVARVPAVMGTVQLDSQRVPFATASRAGAAKTASDGGPKKFFCF